MKKIVLVFFLMISLLFTTHASAFSITPSKTMMTMDTATQKKMVIQIKNTEKKDTKYTVRVVGVRQKNDGKPEFVSGISVAENWLKFENKTVFIKKGGKSNIGYVISVPKSARSGSYYIAIGIRPQIEKTEGAINGEIMSLLNIQVSGLAYEVIQISKWEQNVENSDKNSWLFHLNLANKGNMDVDMKGNISISTWSGREIIKENIYLGNKFLANSVRYLKPKIKIGKKLLLPSIYQAKVTVNYGLINQSVISTDYIIFLPLWFKILVGLILLLIIVLFFSLIKRRRRKRRMAKMK